MESSGSRKGPTTPFELGLKALADRQYDLAVKLFSDAADAGVRRAEALSKRGVCRLHMEDRRSAEADFEAALQADPRHAPALTNLGNLALEDGRLAEARARYEAAISADPDYALAHHNFAVLLKREGKVGDSVRELRLAAKLEAGSFWDFLSGRRRRT